MNKFRRAMILEREKSNEAAKICVKCAGWSSFGNQRSPLYIALHGEICCCQDHWDRLQELIQLDYNHHVQKSK